MQNHRNRRIVTGLLWILGAGGCGDNPVAPGPDGAGAADALANDSATLTDGPRADAASGVVPSNSGDLGGLEHTGLTVGAPSGNFDTDTDCVAPSALGNCRVAQPSGGLPEVCVCRSDELTIGSLQVSGARALALFALRSVTVSGTLDVSGRGLTDGAGAARAYASASDGLVGGTGGSYASSGGGSGAAASYGEAAIIPLQGGMRGQDACSVRGGGAGGALQVSAGEQITVTGRIQAGGGGGRGGRGGGSCLGGAGGGSGGAVLLEAPMVAMTGAAAANGAGGGGGGSTSYGQGASGTDASGMAASAGGLGNDGHGCVLGGYTRGGRGGDGARQNAAAQSGQSADSVSGCFGSIEQVGEGGGGGGLGFIRVNTRSGCNCSGSFSPAPSFGVLTEG